MADRKYIEQEKRWRRRFLELTAKVYAGFVMTLHERFQLSDDDIVLALSDTHAYWQDDQDIVEHCAEMTGIDVMSELTAREQGEDEGIRI